MLDVFIASAFLLIATSAIAAQERVAPPKPIDPVEAAKQGRELVEDILEQRPTKSFTNTGVLRIRRDDSQMEIPVEFNITVTPTNWLARYDASLTNGQVEELEVEHGVASNHYFHHLGSTDAKRLVRQQLSVFPGDANEKFANSDFWLCDLGLEFFHWPDQKVLKTQLRKTRACKVLESTNPNPVPGAYSRVVSWIDVETEGILHAEAYDAQGKLLKEFDTKKFKKIKGEWQLEEMEIRNVQTGSRSQIEFDLDSK